MNEIERLAEERDRYRAALYSCATPIPSTKGMGPKDRAARLHSVLEQRIRIASDALKAPVETPELV